MLKTLPLVQMNKAQREVNQTNQEKHHERSSNACSTLKNKNIFWSKHFPAKTNCRSWHSPEFLVKPVLKIS